MWPLSLKPCGVASRWTPDGLQALAIESWAFPPSGENVYFVYSTYANKSLEDPALESGAIHDQKYPGDNRSQPTKRQCRLDRKTRDTHSPSQQQ